MNGLDVSNLSVSISNKNLLANISFSTRPGEFVAILGANGAGKSTLLKAIAGLQTFDQGTITWAQQSLPNMTPDSRAKVLSYLPQERPTTWPIRVSDVVALGRYAYGVNLGNIAKADQQVVERALMDCDLSDLKNRSIDTLSGGETARVHCARTFASEAAMLLADEPTTSLDPKHQLDILNLLRRYVSETRCVLVVMHEPAMAARFADKLIWMRDGKILAAGTPAETLTSEILAETYDIDATIHPEHQYPHIEFHQSR